MVDPESKERKRLAIYVHPPESACELTSEKLSVSPLIMLLMRRSR